MSDVILPPDYVARFCAVANAEKARVLEAMRGKGSIADARLDLADPNNPALIFVVESGEEVRVAFALYPDNQREH